MSHKCEVVDDFLKHDLHAECSCGWVGDPTDSYADAMAEWATHVHMVTGASAAEQTPMDGET